EIYRVASYRWSMPLTPERLRTWQLPTRPRYTSQGMARPTVGSSAADALCLLHEPYTRHTTTGRVRAARASCTAAPTLADGMRAHLIQCMHLHPCSGAQLPRFVHTPGPPQPVHLHGTACSPSIWLRSRTRCDRPHDNGVLRRSIRQNASDSTLASARCQ